MLFFLDTANLDEINAAIEYGIIDGVTTNPSLLAKESPRDWKIHAKEICKIVDGPVSLEVIATMADKMVKEARELVKLGPNVVIKIPMTDEGLKAVGILEENNIPTNVTLVFSSMQALLAAKAGASYVSPFVGRLDDIGTDGMAVVEQSISIFRSYGLDCQVLAASIRNTQHVLQAALLGADVATVPFSILNKLMKHPLTEKGLKAFLADWNSTLK